MFVEAYRIKSIHINYLNEQLNIICGFVCVCVCVSEMVFLRSDIYLCVAYHPDSVYCTLQKGILN
jgi:hypothetical protein